MSLRRVSIAKNNNAEPVKAGTTIQTEEPFVFILSGKEHGLRCDHCFNKGKVLKCSGCQYIFYCGKTCQREAWPEHKGECAGYRRVLPRVPPDAARLMARIVRKLSTNGAYHKGYYSQSKYRVWKDLMSHYQDLKVDARRMEHFTSLCAILFQFLTDVTLPNSAELMGIYGRMVINSFTILDGEMLSVGTGLYLGTSIVDHCCDPNAVAIFSGKTINIRLTKDIPSLDWSKIFISYIDLLNSPLDRQTELQSIYYFLCQCDRCLDNQQISLMHAACCPNEECDYPIQIPWEEGEKLVILSQENKDKNRNLQRYAKIQATQTKHDDSVKAECNGVVSPRRRCNGESPAATTNGHHPQHTSNGCDRYNHTNGTADNVVNKFSNMSLKNGLDSDDDDDPEEDHLESGCPKCGTRISQDYADKFRSVMEFSRVHLDNMRDKSVTYVDVCRTCLTKQDGVLHPLNIYFVKTLDHAMDGCIQYQMWDQAIRYAKKLLPGFKNYYGTNHPLYGLLLLKLGKILHYERRNEEAIEYLKNANDVLKITHGHTHFMVTQCLLPLYRQAEMELHGTN